MIIVPTLPVWIDANSPHEEGETFFATHLLVYDLIHPELGAVGSFGLTHEVRPYTEYGAAIGMGVADGDVFPSLQAFGSVLVGPVFLFAQGEWDVSAVDAYGTGALFLGNHIAVGAEGELYVADLFDPAPWGGGGPDVWVVANDTVTLGFAWLFVSDDGTFTHVPRVSVFLSL